MTFTDLLAAALATWQIVEIVHHGEIFAGCRSVWEERRNFFDRLRLCPHCLSVWVGLLLAGSLLVSDTWIVRLVVYGFAVSRLANLGNDLGHKQCRTPNAAAPRLPDDASDPGTDPVDV